jgi:DNA-binding response OmpR family regulator/tetratricopeptide (TPR) repeat protein
MSTLSLEACVVDLARGELSREGLRHRLTEREAALLRYLAERPGAVVSRDELLREVWGYQTSVRSRTTDDAMWRLRQKVEADPKNPRHLLTAHGGGYRFVGQTQQAPPAVVVPGPRLPLPDGWYEPATRTLVRAGAPVALSALETELLALLVERAPAVVSPEEARRALGREPGGRWFDRTIRSLRAQIEPDPAEPHTLVGVRGRGVRFASAPPPPAEATLAAVGLQSLEALTAAEPDATLQALTVVERLVADVAGSLGSQRLPAVPGRWRLVFPGVAAALRFGLQLRERWLRAEWPAALLRCPEAAPVEDTAGRTVLRGLRAAIAVHCGAARPVDGPFPDLVGPAVFELDVLLPHASVHGVTVSELAWQRLGAEAREPFAASEPSELPIGGGARAVRVVGAPLEETRHAHLPMWASRFVGRQDTLQELERAFAGGQRLVTLVGLGGVGKTRLAAQAARRSGRFAAGVWFADLSEATGPEVVLASIGRAFGLPLAQADLLGPIAAAAQARGRALLILDECERALLPTSSVIEALLARAPELTLLATSRLPLGLAGEQVVALGPLDPESALALFVEHRRLHDPTFATNPTHRRDIARQVDRLDGTPLALELAARAGPASWEDLGRLLGARVGRQLRSRVTLREVLAWSHDRLAEPEQQALAELSVFEGDFDGPAARAVLSDPDPEARLEALLQSAWLSSHPGPRYKLGPVVRAYAAERAPEDLTEAERRHAVFYGSIGTGDFVRAARELDQLVAAVRRAVLRGEGELAFAALHGVASAATRLGPFEPACSLCALVRTRCVLPPALAGRVAVYEAVLRLRLSEGHPDFAAGVLIAAARTIGEQTDDTTLQVLVESTTGSALQFICSEASVEAAQRALALSARLGPLQRAMSQYNLALAYRRLGRYALEEQTLREAISQLRALPLELLSSLSMLGELLSDQGLLDEARQCYEEGLRLCDELPSPKVRTTLLWNLANLARDQGRGEEIGPRYRALLSSLEEMGSLMSEDKTAAWRACILAEHQAAERAPEPVELELAERAVAATDGIVERAMHARALALRGAARLARGGLDEGEQDFERALSLLREGAYSNTLAEIALARAEAEQHAGLSARAQASLEHARALIEALGPYGATLRAQSRHQLT